MPKQTKSVDDLPKWESYPEWLIERRRLEMAFEELASSERERAKLSDIPACIDAEARALLDSDGAATPTAASPSVEERSRTLHHRIKVATHAIEIQKERLRAKEALLIKNDIIPRLAPLARERAQAVARALHHLAAAMQAEHDFRDDVDRAGYDAALAALPDAGSKGPLGRAGNPNDPDSAINQWIRELLDAGLWPTDCTLAGHYWSGHTVARKLGVVGKSA